jgi:hypothetical protein
VRSAVPIAQVVRIYLIWRGYSSDTQEAKSTKNGKNSGAVQPGKREGGEQDRKKAPIIVDSETQFQ